MKPLINLPQFSSFPTNELYATTLVHSTNEPKVKVFDSSFLNVLKLTGSDRLSYLHGQSTNQIKTLKPGEGTTTIVGNTKAKIISRVEVFIEKDCLYLLHEASTTEALMAQLDMFIIAEDVEMELLSDLYSITYQSESAYSSMFDTDYAFSQDTNGLVFKWTGFGENTITHCFTESQNLDVSDLHFMNAEQIEVQRVLNFYPIANQEYQQNDKLIAELNQNQFVSFSKGCFLGYEILARIKNRGHTNKSLSLIEFDDELTTDPIGEKVYMDDTTKGLVTSHINHLGKSYILAFVPTLLKEIGKPVQVSNSSGKIIQ